MMDDSCSSSVSAREYCLQLVEKAVMTDRNREYGSPEDSFAEIARLWSWYLNRELSPMDVSTMMMLLKMARCKANASHLDNLVDIAGYAVCAFGIQSQERVKKYSEPSHLGAPLQLQNDKQNNKPITE